MAKWVKDVFAMICEFISKNPFLSFLIGCLIGGIAVEICFLISCTIFGWPVNWPVEFPWRFLMK